MTIAQPPAVAARLIQTAVEPEASEGQPESERGVYVLDVTTGSLTITKNGKTFQLRLSDLPTDGVAQFRQVSFCDDGVTKTAYVLMTEPQTV